MSPPLRLRYRWWRKALRQLRNQTVPRLPRAAHATIRYGILPESLAAYNSEEDYDLGLYLSDYARRVHTPAIDGDAGQVLDNKLAFHFAMQPFRDRLPCLFGLIRQGRMIAVPAGEGQRSPLEQVREHLDDGGSLVLKPLLGGRGAGVHVVDLRDGLVHRDGKPQQGASEQDLEGALSACGRGLVTEFVPPAPYSREVYPHTANTLRIITMWDTADDAPFIAGAVHRFGTSSSYPLDHLANGGVAAPVDLATGRLGRAATFRGARSLRRCESHPETHAPITGVQVPRWIELRDEVLKVAGRCPFWPYVGWDIAATEDSFTIIEGNSFPGAMTMQFDRPLLLDERVHDFYAAHGVV